VSGVTGTVEAKSILNGAPAWTQQRFAGSRTRRKREHCRCRHRKRLLIGSDGEGDNRRLRVGIPRHVGVDIRCHAKWQNAETFELVVGGLRYTATVGRFPDGSVGELFLSNHKSNSAADTNARDAAITFSIAIQHGADSEAIRRALCRDNSGRVSGPLGCALDVLAAENGGAL
jgi:ribonucleoside-diphosphate reductase alpha chain